MLSDSQLFTAISGLIEKWCGQLPSDIVALPISGSERKYYRATHGNGTVLGAYNPIHEENLAFITFSKHFKSLGLPVPQVFAENLPYNIYLIEDLGDTTLFSLLPHNPDPVLFQENIMGIYRQVLEILPQFQINASRELDFSVCYPHMVFDRTSMMCDLNYFKYFYLKLTGVYFDEQKLEDDFEEFCDFLLQAGQEYFLYRDFQSRNIMIHNGKPYFIDYQGGRKGALQYDVASLLYDAKANIHPLQRDELLEHYINSIKTHIEIDASKFTKYFYGFVLIRIMQAMGAYGFRGYYEKKGYFLQSVPYAKRNLKWLLENDKIPVGLNYLRSVLAKISEDNPVVTNDTLPCTTLRVKIRSFSYKNGYPPDESGHGGGFVFDCRGLPNPGKVDQFKSMTGKDLEVINYFESIPDVSEFMENTRKLVHYTVKSYLQRGFTSLTVCYGCTGGQHRSVYAAESLGSYLKNNLNIAVDLQHCEKLSWPK